METNRACDEVKKKDSLVNLAYLSAGKSLLSGSVSSHTCLLTLLLYARV